MRVAMLAPLVEAVPPKQYGGTERVISALTEELVRRGPRCRPLRLRRFGDVGRRWFRLPDRPPARSSIRDYTAYTLVAIVGGLRRGGRFRPDPQPQRLPGVRLARLDGDADRDDHARPARSAGSAALLRASFPEQRLVSISRRSTNVAAEANWIGTVHNGIARRSFPAPERGAITSSFSAGSAPKSAPIGRSRSRATSACGSSSRPRSIRSIRRTTTAPSRR